MSADHYAILGVAPTAQPSTIRAAYLALMREFHPDRNPSPAASERTQSIVAAYKVLGDFDSREEYDWGRRREREEAAAVPDAPRLRLSAGLVTIGAIGLAAVGVMFLRSSTAMPPDRIPDVVAQADAVQPPAPSEVVEAKHAKASAATPKKPRAEPIRVATAVVEQPAPRPIKPVRAPIVKAASVRPKATLATIVFKPATTNDLAALDQFVMAFYGQSWRYGDARKRSALEQSRSAFVVRRASCGAEACKRAAYLKLQRDVSSIVESGTPAR